MKISRPLCVLALAGILLPLTHAAHGEEMMMIFHAPTTPPEQALDHILKLADQDADMSDFVLRKPGFKPDKAGLYTPLFTSAFLAHMADEESKQVQEDCGGQYVKGESCGFDYNPITCAQDAMPAYFYSTGKADKSSAVILFSMAARDTPYASYTLTNSDGQWKLSDVECLAAED